MTSPQRDFQQDDRRHHFLEVFSKKIAGRWLETSHQLGSLRQHCVSFSTSLCKDSHLAGIGSSQNRLEAFFKAAMEWTERNAMVEYFKKESDKSVFKDSNGWAAGFDTHQTKTRALTEALERHILQITYLKQGWRGFRCLHRMSLGQFEIASVVSDHICMGQAAGMVLLQGQELPGVSFGYLCVPYQDISRSPKWEHALFEALNYYRRIVDFKMTQEGNDSIDRVARKLLFEKWTWPQWSDSSAPVILPDVAPDFQGLKVNTLAEVGSIHVSYVSGGGLLPLLTGANLNDEKKQAIRPILGAMGLAEDIDTSSIPIL